MIMPRKFKIPTPGPHATKFIVAGGLLALTAFTGGIGAATATAPFALSAVGETLRQETENILGGIPGEMFAGLTEAGAEGLCNKWFTRKGALNHNIQISLQRAFLAAIQELQAKYMIYFPYEEALSILLFKMSDQHHTKYEEVQNYQKQIQETIQISFQDRGTSLGDLEDNVKVKHEEVLANLKGITRDVLEFSFEDLCKKLKPANRFYLCVVRVLPVNELKRIASLACDGGLITKDKDYEELSPLPDYQSIGYIDPPTLEGEQDLHKYIHFKTYQAHIDMSRLNEIFINQASNVNISDPKNVYETIRSKEKVNEKINEDISYALEKINPFLKNIVQENMADYWQFYFAEELKNPDEQGTRAWRAFQRLYQEATLDSIQEVRADIQNISQQLSKQEKKLSEQGEKLSEQGEKLSEQLSEQRDKLSQMHGATNFFVGKSSGIIDESNISHKSIQEERTIQEWTDEIKSMLNYTLGTLPSYDEIKEATGDIKEATGDIRGAAGDIKESAGDIRGAAGDIKESAGIIQEKVARATEILGETEQKLQKSIDRLDEAIGRIEGVADRLEKFLKDARNFVQGQLLHIISVIVLLFGLIALVVFAIHPDNYSLQLLLFACIIWGILVLLLAYPLWNAHPWKVDGMEPGLWTILLFPFLFVLIGFPAFAGERIMEPFKPPMTGDVNVVVSNFDGPEGRGIGQAINKELRIRLKHLDKQKLQIRYPHQRLFSEADTRQIANRWNANIVVRGYEVSGGNYRVEFFMRDPVEGGIELTDDFYILPVRDIFEASTSKRGSIIVTFTRGLIDLFSDELRSDYPYRLETAIASFQQAIDMVEESEEGLSSGGGRSVNDTLYFFKGRSQMKAVEITTASITETRIYSPSQEALLRLSDTITWTDAVESYDQALELNENYSWAHIGHGIVYYNQARETDPSDLNLLNLAFNEFDIALKKEGENRADTSDPTAYIKAKAWANIGNIWTILVQESVVESDFTHYHSQAVDAYTKSLEEYQHAEDFDPRNMVVAGRYPARIHYGMGVLSALEGDRYGDEQKYQDAITSFDTCLDLADEDDPRATRLRRYCETEQAKAMEKINVL